MRIAVTRSQPPGTRVDLRFAEIVTLADTDALTFGDVWTEVGAGGGTVGDWEQCGPLHFR